MKKAILALTLALAFSTAQAEFKTMTCITDDMSPNVDIKIDLGLDEAAVTLILFGNDVDEVPSTGPSIKVNLEDAYNLINGNGLMSFNNNQLILNLKDSSGTIKTSNGEEVKEFKLEACH